MPFLDAGGRPRQYVSIRTDITARKQHEEEVERLTRLYAARTEINQAIARVQSREALLQEVCRAIVGLGEFRQAWIGLLDTTEDRLSPVAACGRGTAGAEPVALAPGDDGPPSLIRRALRDGRPHVAASGRGASGAPNEPSAVFPFGRSGQAIGAINIYETQPGLLGDQEVRLLGQVAEDVSFALESLERVAARQRAETALREAEERLRAATTAGRIGAWDWDLSTGRIAWSEMHATLWGRDWRNFRGTFAEFKEGVHPEDREGLNDAVRRALDTRTAYGHEFRVVWPDGSVHWIGGRGEAIYNENGQPVRMSGVVVDITQRKLAEMALNESRALQSAILESASYAIIAVDFGGRIRTFNPAAERMLGYGQAEMLGRTPEVFHDRDELRARAVELSAELGEPVPAGVEVLIAKPRASGRPEERLWTYIRKDGTRFPVKLAVGPLLGAERQALGFVGIASDITQRIEAEKKLRTAGELLRSLARRRELIREHERTAIAREIHDVLAQELTRLKIDLVWVAKRLAQPVEEPIRRMLVARVEDATAQTDVAISTVQRIATELRPVILDSLGLAAAVEWQVEDFGRRTGLACKATAPSGDSALDRDRATALFRILQESLTNVARHANASAVEVDLTEDDAGATLVVRDNGDGLDAEKADDPHAIGLLGMRERAAAFGGSVEISGRPAGGTTVVARIPRDAAAKPFSS
ncbi:MAG TPA: PAS domain S-box protein [Opitutus sp.]|nr:PAS domain S-box protein [Opitutus sp.]